MSHEQRFPSVIDSTMLSTWRCRRKFQLAFLERYGSQGKSIHLTAGGAYAKGLEVARRAFMEGSSPERSLLLGTHALIVDYGDADAAGTAKTLDRMVGALEFYFDRYPLQTDPCRISDIAGRPAIEFSFGLPLPFNNPDTGEPLLYAGRTDAIMDFVGGRYILDDKTTSSLGESWSRQWTLRSQFTGYAWAARTLGIKTAGTIVRGVSILKTKYDTAQAIINQPDWKIDRWVAHRDFQISEMLAAYATGYFDPALDDTCNEYGGCTFKQICEVSPAQQIQWLETNFVENEWNPLEAHKS